MNQGPSQSLSILILLSKMTNNTFIEFVCSPTLNNSGEAPNNQTKIDYNKINKNKDKKITGV